MLEPELLIDELTNGTILVTLFSSFSESFAINSPICGFHLASDLTTMVLFYVITYGKTLSYLGRQFTVRWKLSEYGQFFNFINSEISALH